MLKIRLQGTTKDIKRFLKILAKNGHEWKARIADRTDGHGCPVCSRQNRIHETVYDVIRQECDVRGRDELSIGGDGGDDRGSNAQSVHRNEREGRGDRQPSENGSSQTQNGNNEKTSERSSEESAVEKIDDDTKALAVKIADRYISVESDGRDWEYMICDEDFGVLYGDKYPDIICETH